MEAKSNFAGEHQWLHLNREHGSSLPTGKKALVMENITDAQDPNLVIVSVEEQSTIPAKPTDRAGRRPDTGPNQKSAVEEESWRSHAKSLFVQDVANLLNRKGLKGALQALGVGGQPSSFGPFASQIAQRGAGKGGGRD